MKLWLTLLTFQLLNLLQVSLSQNGCSRLPGVLNAHVSEQTRKDVYQLGETILFTCDTGFTSDLPIKYVCSSEGWVTLRQESCYSSTASCEHPSAHGGLRINGLPEDNSPIPPGHVLLFGCDDPDKRLNGSSVLICDRDGQWNKPVPSCEAVKCQSLTVNDKILVTGDPEDGTYGNALLFSCKSRSEILKGPTEIYCDESGKWSGEVPECTEVTCDTPQIIHGRVTEGSKVYKEDDYLNFVCDNKYKAADERRSRCIKVGSEAVWSPTPQCLPILCKLNLPPIQGTTFNRYDRNVFSPGDTLTVTCEGDRWIVDMKTTRRVVTCKDNGEWDIRPECQDISCHELRRDRYLFSFYIPLEQSRVNGRANYSCKSGYEKPDGVTQAICTRDGWMPERLCEAKNRCSPPPPIEDGDIMRTKPEYGEGEKAEYVCPRHYAMEGGPLTCRNGQWTGRVRCIKPCTVTQEEMDINNLRILKDWLDKIYSQHNHHLTFRCKSGKRHDGRVAMRQQCIEGVIQLPTCV
ncbi:complement factor H-related protein 1-like isoform X2 [Oryzias latipes]